MRSMKERIIFLNQSELTQRVNPYTLEGRMEPKQEGSPASFDGKINLDVRKGAAEIRSKPYQGRGSELLTNPQISSMTNDWQKHFEEREGRGQVISSEERQVARILGEMGVKPVEGGADAIGNKGIKDLSLIAEIGRVNRNFDIFQGNVGRQLEELRAAFKRVDEMEGVNGVEKAQVLKSIADQESAIEKRLSHSQDRERRNFFTIQSEDMEQLDIDPQGWLSEKFDLFYDTARRGNELESPVFETLQRAFGEATRYLEITIGNRADGTKVLTEFSERYNILINSLFMRVNVESRSIEQIQGAASRLQSHGMFKALSFEDGFTQAMYFRIADKLEDERLRQGGFEQHLYSETVTRVNEDLIEEQMKMVEAGVYEFKDEKGNLLDLDRARKKVERSIRTAYDILVDSQREIVIASRGEHAPGLLAIYSDPGAAFNIFNYEEFLTGKFNILNAEDREFLREMKLRMAYERASELGIKYENDLEAERAGSKLFKDLFAVADFYSSGWRILGIRERHREFFEYKVATKLGIISEGEAYDLIEERLKEFELSGRMSDVSRFKETVKEANNFGLFMQLKGATRNPKDKESKLSELEDIWKKIRKFRTEEVIRLFRDKAPSDSDFQELLLDPSSPFVEIKYDGTDKKEFEFFKSYFDDENLEKLSSKALSLGREELDSLKRKVKAFKAQNKFDGFKQEYGAIISKMREDALNGKFNEGVPEQIDFAHLTPMQRSALVKFLRSEEEAEKLEKMFSSMQGFVTSEKIKKLSWGKEFDDIYTRTLRVDDISIKDLEEGPEGSGLKMLSSIWSKDRGADALVRNMNDISNAMKAGSALTAFLKSEGIDERVKSAMEFAESASQYLGQGGRAKSVRHTVGTLFEVAKKGFFWDVFGIDKPFRRATSRLEEIYGPQAASLTRDDLREKLDHIRIKLANSVGELSDEEKLLSDEEQRKLIEERTHNAEKQFRDLESILEVDKNGRLKLYSARGILALIIIAMIETTVVLDLKNLTSS